MRISLYLGTSSSYPVGNFSFFDPSASIRQGPGRPETRMEVQSSDLYFVDHSKRDIFVNFDVLLSILVLFRIVDVVWIIEAGRREVGRFSMAFQLPHVRFLLSAEEQRLGLSVVSQRYPRC